MALVDKGAGKAQLTKALEDDLGGAPGGGHQHVKVGLVPCGAAGRQAQKYRVMHVAAS